MTDPFVWHRWFARHPVVTLGNRGAYLRMVERRWNPDSLHGWEYRLPVVKP